MNDVTIYAPDEPANMTLYAVERDPSRAVASPDAFAKFYEQLKADAESFVGDVSTAKGRKEIASKAYEIARTKTAIDAAGKALNEAARKQIESVDAVRREVREKLDALKDQVRQPLTDWEAAEARRADYIARQTEWFRQATIVTAFDHSGIVRETLGKLETYEFESAVWQADEERGRIMRDDAVSTLTGIIVRLEKEEADREELERLRAEQLRRDDEERARKAEEERAEAQRIAAEQEAARIEAARMEAAAAAQRAAEQAKADALAAQQAAHDAELARIEAERVKAEQERAALEQAARAAEAERQRAADEEHRAAEARQQDRAHRSAVMRAAKESIMDHGSIEEDAARAIVLAIFNGEVPAVSIKF